MIGRNAEFAEAMKEVRPIAWPGAAGNVDVLPAWVTVVPRLPVPVVGVMGGVVCARLSDAGEAMTRKANATFTHAKERDDARSSLPIMS